MRFSRGIVRRPAAGFMAGLTSRDLTGGDFALYQREHAAYVRALEDAGLEVEVLPALERFPDAHFVEDVAVVTPQVTVLTRPGAVDRRGEEDAIAPVLGRLAALERIVAPGTLDGGDILIVGRHCFIGQSARTNRAGADQLAALLEPHGYAIRRVTVTAGLHLKSSVNVLADDTVLLTPGFARHDAFASFRRIETAPGEEDAANTLRINDHLLIPAGFPATAERLATLGPTLVTLDTSQSRLMDGGLTCLSLRIS